jgi:tetratricopeptide (TPR) repeat protein/DNA-binding XRE family transcriptional regulator
VSEKILLLCQEFHPEWEKNTAMQVTAADWAKVGRRIKTLRRERGLTQKELGEPVASASFLSLIESGSRHPSQEVLEHVAGRLGVEVDELVSGTSTRAQVALEMDLQQAREHLRVGELDRARSLARDVADEAERDALPRLAARAYEVLASIEERRNLVESAARLYQKAETLWRDEPPHLRYETVAGLARCSAALGEARYAIHLLERYLHELDDDGVLDPRAAMRAYATLVVCYSGVGLAAKAAEAADQAQALAPRVPDAEQLACMCMNVARSLYEQGRASDALDALRQAEQAYLSLGWQIDAARAQLNRGIVQIDKGELDDARKNLTEAVDVLKATGTISEAAKALDELARLERLCGNFEQAEAHLLEAQSYLEHGEFAERALNLREVALCRRERDVEGAKGALRRSIDLFLLAGATKEVAVTYKLLGDLHRRSGEIEQSADAYRAGIEAIEARPIDLAG